MYQIQTHFELGCELNNHIGIDNYICHVFQSEEEAYEVAYTMIKAAFTEGRKSIFFSPIFKGGRQDSSYFKAMASQGQLIIQDIKLFNLLNDIKNYLANSQLCQGDETPYLLLDLSQVDHSAFSQLSLFEQLTTLNGYLHTHYKTSLLLQVNADYLPPIKKQMLITMYPTYVINGKVRNNHLYKAPTFPENQVKVQNSQGVINIHRLDLPAYETDTSGEIVYCSPSFAELLGYKVEEIISKDEIDLVAGRKDLFPVMNTRKYKLPDSSLDLYYFQTAYFRADGSSIIADEIICSIQVKEQDYTNYHLLRFSEGDPDSYYMLMHNKKFHRLFNTGNAALIMLEPLQSGDGCIYDAQITELSQSLPGLINTSGRSLSDHTITDLNCQQVDLWLRAINSVVESGGQAYFETYEAVNDKYLDVMVFNPVSGPMIALVSDVSQVKRIEERFQKQIVFLENILDGIPTPVFYRDTCGRFQFANKAFAIAIGLDRRDILGQSLFKVLPEDLASKYRAMDLDLLTNAGIQTYEWEFQHANGNRYDVIFNKAPLSNSEEEFIGVVGTFIDITQRKEAQEALRLSEEKFRGIFRQSPIGIAVYNPKGQLIDVNMAMTNILGIDSIEDVRHFNLFADRHFKHGDEHILNKMAILSYEEELDFDKIRSVNAYKTNKTGKSFIKYFISPLRYPDGSIEGFLVQIQDITEQKIAAEALQASEANLRRLTDNMIDMIGQVNIAGSVKLDEKAQEFLASMETWKESFIMAMDDDLNTAKAIAFLFDMAHSLNSFIAGADVDSLSHRSAVEQGQGLLRDLGEVLGIFMETDYEETGIVDRVLEIILDLRQMARQDKDYATADHIRDFLKGISVSVEDTGSGSRIRYEKQPELKTLMDKILELRSSFRQERNYSRADYVRNALLERGIAVEDSREGARWKLVNA